jgi:secondary thiamine-phosphate synthase enzyme
MKTIEFQTRHKEEFVDITAEIQESVRASKIENGICLVYVPHTTAGLTINEHADPDVTTDILMALKRLVPDSLSWNHGEGNAPAHVRSSLIGSSVQVIVEGGRLALGTWQGIFFCEFDGPRRRRVYLKILADRQ